MPATVNLTIMTEDRVDVPNAAAYSQYRVSLANGPDPRAEFVPFGTFTHRFTSVAPGAYTARWELANTDGQILGPGVSLPVTIEADIVLKIPTGLTVEVIRV